MSDSMSFLSYIPSVLYILVEIILLIACFILMSKQKNIATILMVITSFAAILFSIIGLFAFSFAGVTDFDFSYNLSLGVSSLGAISNMLFAVGLGMYAMNYVSKSK